MKTRIFAGVLFALLAANALVAQGGALPPPVWLEVEEIDPAASGEYYIPCGHPFTLSAYRADDTAHFVILATACGPGTTMCWEILALGSPSAPSPMSWSGFVPDNMVPCSFMLTIASHGDGGWWYISAPLVVHLGVDLPIE